MQYAKCNSKSNLLPPLAADVKLLVEYLRCEAQCNVEILNSPNDQIDVIQAWNILLELTLSQIIIFNRRRAGEVSKMMLSDYDRKQLENADGNFNDCLSSFEKMLCKLFYRTEIIGKKGKTVPVLFPSPVKLYLFYFHHQ